MKRLRKARLDTAGVIGAALKDSAPLISTFFHGEIISSQQVRPRQQIDAPSCRGLAWSDCGVGACLQSTKNRELTLYLNVMARSRKSDGLYKIVRQLHVSEQASRPVKGFILEHSHGLRSHFGGFRSAHHRPSRQQPWRH